MRKLTLSWIMLVGCLVGLCGCPSRPPRPPKVPVPEYDRPLPMGEHALRKITAPQDIPDFTRACADLTGLRQSVEYSLNYLAHPSSRKFFPMAGITHEKVVASLRAFAALLDQRLPPAAMSAAIREKFDVYTSVGWDGRGTVLFTGYYTPIFEASPVRTGKFRFPLYGVPPNLVKGPDGTLLGWRGPDGSLRPAPSRRDLETSGVLAGQELVWLSDAFEAYVAHVQGSVRLRFPDGREKVYGYAADNGHEYRSVGEELVKDNKIPKESLSLAAMMAYFRAHPEQVNEYVWRNPRFIFFTESGAVPVGCLNQPVTPLRTVATDKSIFPRGALVFLAVPLPQRVNRGVQLRHYEGFALDQDAGGAIRAPGRCDIYMGVGDEAGELTGHTRQEGRLYYLFLK